MVRKTKKQLVQRVVQLLEYKPMTINEISVEVGSNWDTVAKAIDMLKSINIILEIEEGNKKLFKRVSNVEVQKRSDTLFGIPISRKSEELCHFLFNKVKKRWIQETKQEPNRTQMQKVVGEIADNVKLPYEIPRGWYLFGQMCVLEYNPEEEYNSEFKNNILGLDEGIDNAIKIYSKCGNTYEVQAEQYQRKDNKLYLAKLKLKKILYYKLDQNAKLLISKLLPSLIINFPEKEDNKEIIQLLNAYNSLLNRLFLERNESGLEELHNLIIDCFISIWELMATYNLFSDLVHGNYGYTFETLKKYFDPRFDTLIALCKDYLEELNNYLLPKEFDKDSKLYKLMGSAKPRILTKEDNKKLFENYEDKDTSNIFRELNLN